ncbi:MAG: hypothetical protein RIC55_09040 [Pirellulaceae bacterium]
MPRRTVLTMLLASLLLGGIAEFLPADESAASRSESEEDSVARGVAFLAREVPQWRVDNKCYSCHNNGDAARALMRARKQGVRFEQDALANTLTWLRRPDAWRHNGGEGEFNDRRLAAIQFGAALTTAHQTGLLRETTALRRAAALVADQQQTDGRWQIDSPPTIGSPATYGTALATASALRLLIAADDAKFQEPITRAKGWLRKFEPKNTPDTAGVLLGLAGDDDPAALAQRQNCITRLRKAQSDSGGWGPYTVSRAEPFDTAIAVLALAQSAEFDGRQEMIARGKQFLIETQLDDGSWPETTRPSGDVSYAQRLSTSGWCTLALLATREG